VYTVNGSLLVNWQKLITFSLSRLIFRLLFSLYDVKITVNLMSSIQNQNIVQTGGSTTGAVHLDDTSFLNQAVKGMLIL
jgi:hypothetical protein